MKKLRWVMDGGLWDLDMATPRTIDGAARPVPGDLLPLGLSRGIKLTRPKQLDFMHKFMSIPLVPSYADDTTGGGDGFSLQRAISIPFTENWFVTLLGELHLQKLISRVKQTISKDPPETSWLKVIGQHLRDKSLYALGFNSEFSIGPDFSLLLNWEAYDDKRGSRNKAVIHQELPNHNLTLEAMWPGLFVDQLGSYWDVPISVAIDLASLPSNSGSTYHLCIHQNEGQPNQFGSHETSGVPPNLQPGFCAKAAYSVKKDFDIWRSKDGKLKMVQPFDIFLTDPHVSASTIIGYVFSASFADNSIRPPTEDGAQDFGALNVLAQGQKYALLADLFASVSCKAQHGNFQRLFFDLTRLSARLDFPSGSRFIAGAAHLAQSFYNYQQPDSKAVRAICPEVTLSLQQQIAGPFSFRVDSRITFDTEFDNRLARVDESVFAVEYAMKVLGSAKAVAWYSTKHREAMVELRFFES